jgi:hypothetical protein
MRRCRASTEPIDGDIVVCARPTDQRLATLAAPISVRAVTDIVPPAGQWQRPRDP